MLGSYRKRWALRCAAAASTAVGGMSLLSWANPQVVSWAEAPSSVPGSASPASSSPSTAPDNSNKSDVGSAGPGTVAAAAAVGTVIAGAVGAAQEAVSKKTQPHQKKGGSTPKQSTIAAMGICGPVVPMEIKRLKPYEGRWVVTYRSPNSMESFFDLFQVSNWVRWFARHLSGYHIQVDEAAGLLRVDLLSPIPFLKITEIYNLDGRVSTNRRRDFRAGVQFGRVELREGCLILHLHWGAPLRGTAEDTLRLTSTNTLLLTSDAHLEAVGAALGEGQSASFRCLYHRDEGSFL